MDIHPNLVTDVARSVWRCVLGLEIDRDGDRSRPGDECDTACVRISGDWNGLVMLQCPAEVAAHAAAMMFGKASRRDATAQERRDAVAELVNMIGGNLKSLLSGRCVLSVPNSPEARDDSFDLQGRRCEAEFFCLTQRVAVTVLEQAA